MANARQFALDLEKFGKDLVPEELVAVQKKITLDLHGSIMASTPVDTGRARGNWHASISTPNRTVLEAVRAPSQTLADAESGIAGLKPFVVTWISNNLPYIAALEEGHSPQAPPGAMVAVNVARIEAILS